ncbi:MAG: hypothetical protein Cons2KO_12500 [Congregibacter sp.]
MLAMSFYKRRICDRVLRTALLLLVSLTPLAAQSIENVWSGVERIVAIGDVHGDYDNYLTVLKEAGLIDKRGKWAGGKTHFVQVGDVPDRGPDTDKVIRHLMKLEKQARKAGGFVHALIGNHEAMNMVGDLRYVHPGEYEALTNRGSKKALNAYYERVVDYLGTQDNPPVINESFRKSWYAKHPVGFVEHRQIWHPLGEFGKWVSTHNAVIKINGILFVHGGLGKSALEMDLDDINATIRSELRAPSNAPDRLSDSEDGPLWYRGLAQPDNAEEALHLEALLEHFDAQRLVIGHTPGMGTIVPRYDARVLIIDSGLSGHYGGYKASLLVESGELFTRQGGELVPIPGSQDALLPYYKKIAALQPGINNLEATIQRLENPPREEPAEDEPLPEAAVEN